MSGLNFLDRPLQNLNYFRCTPLRNQKEFQTTPLQNVLISFLFILTKIFGPPPPWIFFRDADIPAPNVLNWIALTGCIQNPLLLAILASAVLNIRQFCLYKYFVVYTQLLFFCKKLHYFTKYKWSKKWSVFSIYTFIYSLRIGSVSLATVVYITKCVKYCYMSLITEHQNVSSWEKILWQCSTENRQIWLSTGTKIKWSYIRQNLHYHQKILQIL